MVTDRPRSFDEVLAALGDRKDLGLHTEMFSDGLVDLFEAGVVTNEKKSLHRGKIVASFVIGTRRAFDFVDNNPFMEFHPNEYVNDPYVVARNDKMVAINSALSVAKLLAVSVRFSVAPK